MKSKMLFNTYSYQKITTNKSLTTSLKLSAINERNSREGRTPALQLEKIYEYVLLATDSARLISNSPELTPTRTESVRDARFVQYERHRSRTNYLLYITQQPQNPFSFSSKERVSSQLRPHALPYQTKALCHLAEREQEQLLYPAQFALLNVDLQRS